MDPRAPEPEVDLVRACADGDEAAWGRFVERYAALLAALARRMLLRRTGYAAEVDVDEVVGAVFLALVKGERRLLRRYRAEFRVSTYLGVICRTEVGRLARAASRRPLALGDDAESASVDPAPGPAEALAARERDDAIRSLRAALAELGERDRLLLSLRYLDGADYGVIAEVLRVRRDSVGQLLHRAKERLALRVPSLSRWVREGSGS